MEEKDEICTNPKKVWERLDKIDRARKEKYKEIAEKRAKMKIGYYTRCDLAIIGMIVAFFLEILSLIILWSGNRGNTIILSMIFGVLGIIIACISYKVHEDSNYEICGRFDYL